MTATNRAPTRHLRRSLAAAVRATAAGVDMIKRPSHGVVVLAYHRVGAGTDSLVDLPVEMFRRQMDLLATDFNVVPLDEAIQRVKRGDTTSAVALTFDDGTTDFMSHALPIMAELNLPSSIYLATSFADTQTPFAWGAPPISWSDARDAVSSGLVTIEAHTHEHRVMDKVDAAAAAADLDRCNQLIEDNVGVAPRHFAYPKGVIGTSDVRSLVADRYRSAAGARVGVNTPGTDVYELRRSPIQSVDDGPWFERKAAGGLALEGHLREAANHIRYRRSVT